jgi:uncharacterized protein YprB with RNaseH-like and TPR domain
VHELPDWLRQRLHAPPQDPAPQFAPKAVGLPAGFAEQCNEHGAFLALRTRFERTHVHGSSPLHEISAAESAALALVARDPALAALAPADGLFLDIETNGLQGGAGGIAFLVALGEFRGAERETFELWQGFLRDPAEECALLAEVAARVRAAPLLVSFFGKSFDRHRLEDKMRYHGIAPPFTDKPHLDLYWPCRRLYGAGLPNGRLATMERELLGFERADDLPGSLAPAAWLDWLAGRAHRLDGVLAHNRDDLLSLVGLVAHLGRVEAGVHADGRPLRGAAERRAEALARLRSSRPRR